MKEKWQVIFNKWWRVEETALLTLEVYLTIVASGRVQSLRLIENLFLMGDRIKDGLD